MKSNFEIIYYVNFGFPSIEYSLSIVDLYVEAGAKNFQFDLPTKHPDPNIENDMILDRMRKAFLNGKSYEYYLNGIKAIKEKYNFIKLELTVYADTILEIGLQNFIVFCKATGINKVSVVVNIKSGLNELLEKLRLNNIYDLHPIVYSQSLNSFDELVKYDEPISLLLEEGVGQKSVASLERVKEIVEYVDSLNPNSKIYGTMGIRTIERVKELKDCNLDGVYVGSCLINLWNQPSKLKEEIRKFESLLEVK